MSQIVECGNSRRIGLKLTNRLHTIAKYIVYIVINDLFSHLHIVV